MLALPPHCGNNFRVLRRIHVPAVRVGEIVLDPAEAHHIRDVLRVTSGAEVELFDDGGAVARGVITTTGDTVVVRVETIDSLASNQLKLTVAAAVPKGDRADWMVEKLSELGVDEFVPLASERSVVLPRGTSKHERWQRIAMEAAKQSRRRGVMRIGTLTELLPAIECADSNGWFFSTAAGANSIASASSSIREKLHLFIGPEGGWTPGEIALFDSKNLTPVALTATILRVETAAIAAAAIVLAMSRDVGTKS